MRVATVLVDDRAEPAAVRDDGLVALGPLGYGSMLELIEAGPPAWDELAARAAEASPTWAAEAVTFLPPIPRPPRNMFCVGANYKSHFDEADRGGASMPPVPVLFTKPWTALSGHDGAVDIHRHATQRVDWEAELAVVIGVGGRDIAPEHALDHVFGYTLANDVSARDLQFDQGAFSQAFKGKGLDGFCPMGPVIVLRSDAPDPREMRISLTVNGVVKQDYDVSQMYHSIEVVIARMSLAMRLLPGDIVLTGTSSGVGFHRDPPEYLQGGDVVEVSSDAIGVLRTRFVDGGQ